MSYNVGIFVIAMLGLLISHLIINYKQNLYYNKEILLTSGFTMITEGYSPEDAYYWE